MSEEVPNFILTPGQRRGPQTACIIRGPGQFEAHFATGVSPKTHLSQTSSTTYNSIFWVNVAFCRILSHRRGPEAPNFAKFAASARREEAKKHTCRIFPAHWKACSPHRLGSEALRQVLPGRQPCGSLSRGLVQLKTAIIPGCVIDYVNPNDSTRIV
jgi:hypothetical protein